MKFYKKKTCRYIYVYHKIYARSIYPKQIGKRVREKRQAIAEEMVENRNGLLVEQVWEREIGIGTATISGNNYKREHSPKMPQIIGTKRQQQEENCNGKWAGRVRGVSRRQARIGKRAKLHNL